MTTDKTKRTPCEVWTRVMGYLRPVSHYNIGKNQNFIQESILKRKR